MRKKLSNYTPILLIVLISLLFANLQINKRSGGNNICWNISGDGRGYYAWLPAIFIYHDLNFTFADSVEKIVSPCGLTYDMPIQEYRHDFEGKKCNKYYPGTSLMMLPFFTVAHFYTAWFTNYAANGYSIIYFRLLGLAGIFYYLAGMLFIMKILHLSGLSNMQKILAALFITFGTNAIYYSIDTPSWSHIFSFSAVAAFTYFAICLKKEINARYICYLSLLAGLIFVVRPVNIVILLLLPFLLKDKWREIFDFLKQKPYRLIYAMCGILLPVAMLMLYKISTGNYFIYSYQGEHFDFLHPHLWQFLFHYDNGILPYTPMLLIAFLFAGGNPEYKSLVAAVIVTLAVAIYVNSSWWCWWYAISFGSRTMLDFLPLFGIIIGLSLKQKNVKRQIAVAAVYVLCCGWTMALYHQKSHNGYMYNYPITDYWEAIYNAWGIR